jgi:hypothetical protein
MIEDFLTKDLPSAKLGDSLNQLGKDGWLIVNCWPGSSGNVTCVFRRPRFYFCTKTKRYESARPLALLSLPFALTKCLAEPGMSRTKSLADVLKPSSDLHSMPLARLGDEFAAPVDEVVAHLKKCGLKESPKSSGSFSAFVDDHSLWIYRKSAAAPWVLYAKKTAAKAAKSPAPPEKENPSDSTASESVFSVDDAIAFCLEHPPKKTGYDHSVLLSNAAKQQPGTDLQSALEAFKQIGLPTANHKDVRKRYITRDAHQIALVEWDKHPGVWFLNVKSTPDSPETPKGKTRSSAQTGG